MYKYYSAFQCISHDKQLVIPKRITRGYVKYTEEMVNCLYSHSEHFHL